MRTNTREALTVQIFAGELIKSFLANIDRLGILGCGALLIIGMPGEVIIPPVAYVEAYQDAHGSWPMIVLLTALVVLSAAAGYTLSALWIYALSRTVGRPLIRKYGRYLFITEAKLAAAERWVSRFGSAGIVLAVFVPGLRHAICVPAGIVGMRLKTFIPMAFLGGLLWGTMLAVFGLIFAKDMQLVVQSAGVADDPVLQAAIAKLTWASVSLVVLVAALYLVFVVRQPHAEDASPHSPTTSLEGAAPAEP
jgi:membrane protein DedA with SNARE-associated domain